MCTLERLHDVSLSTGTPLEQETVRLHLERYKFAARLLQGPEVLDMACGEGYGTALLEERSPGFNFTGVDIDPEAIEYAKRIYNTGKIFFTAEDAFQFKPAKVFNTIVSIETIEHVKDPVKLILHLKTLMAPGGIIIASVPTTLSTDANPFHLKDFTEKSFLQLFRKCGFSAGPCLRQNQPFNPFSFLSREKNSRLQKIRENLPGYYARHPSLLLKRIACTLRHGFVNKYCTAVFQLSSRSS